MFIYKFNADGFLLKYKTRFCMRKNLQTDSVFKNNAITILATHIFRALAAIIAAFDLKMKQFDVINTFINSLLDKIVYCESSSGFEKANIMLFLIYALYRFRYSFLL